MSGPTVSDALTRLEALADPAAAAAMAAYHKAPRRYLGIRVPVLTDLAKGWRDGMSVPERSALAQGLWDSDIHEARVAAAKLLVQARIAGDGPVWDCIAGWVPQFDGWAIADHACDAGARRVIAHPARLDEVERWVNSPHLWTRRAALVITLPFGKSNHPTAVEQAARDRILGWAATMADDRDWFIQKAIAWWLRDLSKHDAPRARDWLSQHGARLKPFARNEAGKYL